MRIEKSRPNIGKFVAGCTAAAAALLVVGCGTDDPGRDVADTSPSHHSEAVPSSANTAPAAARRGEDDASTRQVPEVRGDRPVVAQQKLEAAGLQAEIRETGHPGDRGPGGGQYVISEQDPQPGASVPAGTSVTLELAEPGISPQ